MRVETILGQELVNAICGVLANDDFEFVRGACEEHGVSIEDFVCSALIEAAQR